jgi:hypothetical protein
MLTELVDEDALVPTPLDPPPAPYADAYPEIAASAGGVTALRVLLYTDSGGVRGDDGMGCRDHELGEMMALTLRDAYSPPAPLTDSTGDAGLDSRCCERRRSTIHGRTGGNELAGRYAVDGCLGVV